MKSRGSPVSIAGGLPYSLPPCVQLQPGNCLKMIYTVHKTVLLENLWCLTQFSEIQIPLLGLQGFPFLPISHHRPLDTPLPTRICIIHSFCYLISLLSCKMQYKCKTPIAYLMPLLLFFFGIPATISQSYTHTHTRYLKFDL